MAVSSTSRITKAHSPIAEEQAVAARLAAGEAAVIAACTAAGVGWTLLRPTLIYAEGEDRNISRLAGLIARFGVLPLAGRGEGLRQPVHAADLAHAAVVRGDRGREASLDLPHVLVDARQRDDGFERGHSAVPVCSATMPPERI